MSVNYKLAGTILDLKGQFLGRYVFLWHPSQQDILDQFCQAFLDTYESNPRFRLVRDLETMGLDPTLGQIILTSVSWDDDNALVFVPANFDLTLWKKVLETVRIDNQNNKFDIKWEKHHYGVKVNHGICTFHGAQVAFTGKVNKFGLDNLVDLFLPGIKIEKDIRKDFIQMVPKIVNGVTYWVGNPGYPSLDNSHIEYAARDSLLTYRLVPLIVQRLESEGLMQVWKQIEHPLIDTYADLELEGICVDWDFVQAQLNEGETFLSESYTKIQEKAALLPDKVKSKFSDVRCDIQPEPIINPKTGKPKRQKILKEKKFNPGSPTQLLAVFSHYNLLVKDTKEPTLADLRSSLIDKGDQDKEALEMLNGIIEYRDKATFVGKYPKAWANKFCHPLDGRIHPGFFLITPDAQTGRGSANQPNVLAIEEGFRPAIIADPDCDLSIRDYSGFEMRAAAGLSKEPVMLKAFLRRAELLPQMLELCAAYDQQDPDHFVKQVMEKGFEVKSHEKDLCKEFMSVDIHRQNGAAMFGVPPHEVTGELRSCSKTSGYLALYDGGASRLQTQLAKDKIYYTRPRCVEILEKFHGGLPVLSEFMESLRQRVITPGWVATPLGRKKYALLPPYWRNDYADCIVDQKRKFVNFPFQGANADAIKLSQIELNQFFEDNFEKKERPRILLAVHDELVISIPKCYTKEIDPIIKDVMIKNGQLATNHSVPIECSGVISPCWVK